MIARTFLFPGLLILAAGLVQSLQAEASGKPPHHVLEVRLDPENRKLSGRDRITLSGQGTLVLRLARFLTVKGLTVDGQSVAPDRSGDILRVQLGSSGDHVVTVDYGQARQSGQSVLMDREGLFFPETLAWFPRLENTAQTYVITLDMPDPGRAVLPGRLVSENSSEGRYQVTFASEVPAHGVVLMAGPYEVRERMHKSVRLRTYFEPSLRGLSDGYLDKTADYLDLYQGWIGKYPFSAFHIVSSPLPVGLGFPNMTYIGARVLRLPFIRHSSLGHEVLHSWWGNGVYVAGASGNWAEGLTTFMADYTYALKRGAGQGAGKGRAMRLNWLRDYMALPSDRDRPVYEFAGKRHDASQVIGYNKTAFFFHMLRNRIGEKIFESGVKVFWSRHRFKSAAWDDLRDVFEDASGQDLGAFFDQWLRRTGAPRLRLDGAAVTERKVGYQVSLSLSQTNPVYDLLVPVEITTPRGTERFIVAMTDKIFRTTLNLKGRPLSLAVDPGYDLFRKLDPGETPPILRDVTLGKAFVLILGKDEPLQKAAIVLAERLLDVSPQVLGTVVLPDAPLLVIGLKEGIDEFLTGVSLPPEPAVLAGRGTARIWTGRGDNGQPYLVVSADDVGALSALIRPLPHYLRQGFLVFSASKVIYKGEWPAKAGSLNIQFDGN